MGLISNEMIYCMVTPLHICYRSRCSEGCATNCYFMSCIVTQNPEKYNGQNVMPFFMDFADIMGISKFGKDCMSPDRMEMAGLKKL